jgi:hypothetical protein
MAEVFEVTPLALKDEAIEQARRTARDDAERAGLAEACASLARDAFAADEFALAKKALRTGESASRGLRDGSHAARLRVFGQEVARIEREHRSVARHLERLAADPADAGASLGLGRFLCLWKNDWERGLQRLALGSDRAFKAVAEKELAAAREGADEAAARLELGELWLDKAGALGTPEKEAALARALGWFGAAAVAATGLERERLIKRLEELARAVPPVTLAARDPRRPSGLVAARFDGKDLAAFQPVAGAWDIGGGEIIHAGADGTDEFLASFAAASWLRIVFEFMGGKPGLYFSADGTPVGRVGVNLDAEAKYNGEIRRPVDMTRWNEVVMERTGTRCVFWLNGERVHEMGDPGTSHVLIKAQLGRLRVRKLAAVGYNP